MSMRLCKWLLPRVSEFALKLEPLDVPVGSGSLNSSGSMRVECKR
jgi:hypothetical protein